MSRSCAVASDGSLLSPSKIDFYNDPNDDVPISGPSFTVPTAQSTSTIPSSTTTIDSYFASHQPMDMLTNLRRTTRPSKPSAWVRDAADSLNSATTAKHKTTDVLFHRCVAHKVSLVDSDSDLEAERSHDKSTPSPSPSLRTVDDTEKAMECGDGTDVDEVLATYDET